MHVQIGYREIATFILAGPLLNYIIPTYFLMFAKIAKSSELNELYFGIGGKIHRKWFFLNILISFLLLVIITLLAFWLRNWLIYLLLLPYSIALFILNWNNIYKRMNAITNNHVFSLLFMFGFMLWCLLSKIIYKHFSDVATLACMIIVACIWIVLFLVPTKKVPDIDF